MEALASETAKAIYIAATATSAAVGVVSTVQAQKMDERASKARDRIAATETRRRQLDQLARMRAIRANMQNVAEQTGTSGSSAVVGGVGAITTSAADNIGYLQGQYEAGREVASLAQRAENRRGTAQIAGAVASVAGMAADKTGAWDELFKG